MPPDARSPVAQQAVPLSSPERHEARRRTAVRAAVVHAAITAEGEEELRRPSSALAWSGLAAGLSMGFSMVTEGLLQSALPDTPWRHLVAGFGYSVGFLIVVLGRQQLFTEQTLTVVLPLLTHASGAALSQVARVWSVVFAANIAGAALFAVTAAFTEVFTPEARQAFATISEEVLRPGFGTMLLRAIFAGWLIALMVWLLPFAGPSRVGVIILITYVIGLGNFTHVIAGSVEVFFATATGIISVQETIWRFLLPAFLGNTIGGVSLVAAVNHAQVVAGRAELQRREAARRLEDEREPQTAVGNDTGMERIGQVDD